MATLIYPRLPRDVAHKLIIERAAISLAELSALSSLSHPDAEPSATGGHPADVRKVAEIREAVRVIAQDAGYPRSLGTSTQDFDRPCGTILLRIMDIVPADAAEEGVWSFLSLVVVPEIGPWRFPGRSDGATAGTAQERLATNVVAGARALGPDLESAPEGCTPLGEDESVQIMERPSLGGNRRTAQALQAALWRAEQNGLPVARSEVMRELARRLRGTKSHIALDALDDQMLGELLDHLMSEALNSMQS